MKSSYVHNPTTIGRTSGFITTKYKSTLRDRRLLYK